MIHPLVGWDKQTVTLVGLRSRGFSIPLRRTAMDRLVGLRSPTKDFRDLGPPYMNNPGWRCGDLVKPWGPAPGNCADSPALSNRARRLSPFLHKLAVQAGR